MKSIIGKWRITNMELWDKDDCEILGPALINITREGGSFNFIAVSGEIDCRHSSREGRPYVEFSWEGSDEYDPVHGRGWAKLEEDGTLSGRIFFHQGDDSLFAAKRCPAAKAEKARKRRPQG